MQKSVLTFSEQKEAQEESINAFIEFFSIKRDLSRIVYTDWTAKDVLGHVASWHISFAKNLVDAVNEVKPSPFKGSLTNVNEKEVVLMSKYSVDELIEAIKKSQKQIRENIGNQNIKSIAYKKGSRDYSPVEHLEVVRNHVNSHLKDLRKIYNENE